MNDAGTKVGPTPAGNTPSMCSYANVTSVPSRKALNFRTLFTPARNMVDVVFLVESIRAISERFTNTTYGFFLGKRVAYPVVANYVRNTWGKYGLVKSMLNSSNRIFSFQFSSIDGLDVVLENDRWSSYARALIEVRADVELKDNIVVAMPKIVREGLYTCTIHVEYEWKPLRCACCKVFGHVQGKCPKNIDSDVVNNMKKPSQATRGVPVSPKKDTEPIIEVSNSNPFDVLDSVENDVDLGTNGGTSNLARKVTFVDDEGKPLAKVDSSGDHESENEVALVDNKMAIFLASKKNMNDAGTEVGPTPAGNTPSMCSYANVTSVPSRKALNFRTLFTPKRNMDDVVFSMESIRAISERSRYARALIEVRADVELKDNIVVAMPKIVREGLYTCTIHVKYEWKPLRCACCKVFGHVQGKCPKNIYSDVGNNMKKPSQATRGVLVGPKKDTEPIIEVSNSNPFDVLDSVENDVDLGTNGGTSNLARKVTFVDDEGKPLAKVDYLGDRDSENEETYENDDYDFDPLDDDMYEGEDIPDKIQAICDNLDIKVRGRKKK
ncbi:reverse transcriptase domain, reverse transcriptase zinc-binding domain protein [Tanacetum coccineum]